MWRDLLPPIVVSFPTCPCVSQHTQSLCLVIAAGLPNVDRLVHFDMLVAPSSVTSGGFHRLSLTLVVLMKSLSSHPLFHERLLMGSSRYTFSQSRQCLLFRDCPP